jgi:hypothetical protein
MARKTKHNPERKSWKGVSYKAGRKRVRAVCDRSVIRTDKREQAKEEE